MSAVLVVEDVVKRFGPVTAVDGVSASVAENEFFALLGPSGCGKTTLLRMLAGFEEPDAGRLLLDGRDLVGVKPNKRPVNMMFQSYALFPHMTVEENVMYGLRAEGVRKGDALGRAREALSLVQLGALGARRPAQLSGGQRQRVALARALVKRPRVLLLDEPLSALDRQIRGEMQLELKRLQHSVGTTFVVVTHDQEEALTMADRIAVMRDGRVDQVGTPEELYERPATRFVAGFLGDANLLSGHVAGDRVGPWRVPAGALSSFADGDAALVVVRPERLSLTGDRANTLRGRVVEVVYLGTARRYVVDVPSVGQVQVRVAAGDDAVRPTAGDEVTVSWDPADCSVVAGEGPAAASEEPHSEVVVGPA